METKWSLLDFLISPRRDGKRVAGYGAPGKGNTLLNYCGIRTDLLEFTVDRNPYKQGQFLPGTHIPIRHPRRSSEDQPGLRAHPAVEPPGRDRGAARLRARVGRAASSSRSRKWKCSMKVVLFCGGLGLRMRETSEAVPKPMIPIGYRPILWHVMKYYAHFGYTDFILCLGYRAEVIKQYFLNYNEAMSNDFVLSRGPEGRTVQDRHPGLEHHLRRHRPARLGSASGCAPSSAPSATRRCSSPTTATR